MYGNAHLTNKTSTLNVCYLFVASARQINTWNTVFHGAALVRSHIMT